VEKRADGPHQRRQSSGAEQNLGRHAGGIPLDEGREVNAKQQAEEDQRGKNDLGQAPLALSLDDFGLADRSLRSLLHCRPPRSRRQAESGRTASSIATRPKPVKQVSLR
jgi:hypothetical protein